MDKEILRIVIIATGMVVVIGMLVWAYIKDKKAREDLEFYDDDSDESLAADASVDTEDDFDIIPLGAAKGNVGGHQAHDKADRYYDEDEDEDYYEQDDDVEPPPRAAAPAIIQFSIITKADEDFNGADLVEAFKMVGLEYGSLKIFERLDANRLVDFGVACIVEPGTFPDKDLENFYCPGIVFFMQPEALDDAPAVFDDYIETINLLAEKLDGVVLDHRRQPLTDATVQSIRQSL
ncbi:MULTISPECIES: cell division protein ZipA C-terminal FtsZ-binding domain-containing protein [Methylobacter]|jgi:cell division protein ZipA|uniref:Cell division protein ZipA n=1 Tax=Methylobacter tundripaludum TaxID=173365 RepID=A0A2S6HGH5_9GAMM|nr:MULTISPECIES: cell division protein ZipA C-terminal FtsZ-binding domain-containing protein [Methylobacter]MDI1279079.1 cell division protein ZipA C-terminal FtsZ-binding domain-containing protein [Methylobacter sp.]MDI1359898.1 cell division protein ZipA C-terminal FtsZ-binding domain-containing protein [Methylobacter sp.]PPK76550.1 cell division protein ZipA [Methylobacter tundripaludum]